MKARERQVEAGKNYGKGMGNSCATNDANLLSDDVTDTATVKESRENRVDYQLGKIAGTNEGLRKNLTVTADSLHNERIEFGYHSIERAKKAL